MSVTLSVSDTIATITLNRPEKRNALSQAMLAELERIADSMRGAGDVRAVVLRGIAWAGKRPVGELADAQGAGH